MKFSEFVKKYPHYSRFRFSNRDGDVVFNFNGYEYYPFDKDGNIAKTLYRFPGNKWKPENINDFLDTDDQKAYKEATEQVEGFPQKYKFNGHAEYSIIPWDSNPDKLNYYSFDIYITPKQKTNFSFRNIFTNSLMTFKTAKEAQRWLDSPNLAYWSQALNFAVWCSTAGCGVTRDMLDDSQVGSFYKFHVIFTIRRVLSELQCPLPNDKHFSEFYNFYNKAAYQKLKTEFKTSNDFRYISPYSHGLGLVYSYDYHGLNSDSRESYVPYKGELQLSDEWKSTNHQNHFEIVYVKDPKTAYQYEWFFPEKSQGLTKAGLSRINQSIEAFVYCILGSQAQTRNSILGSGGGNEETKQVFLKLFESSVVEKDISKSIQRYQFALQQAKQKLDLALALGCWLSPSYLLINTSSIAGYNNKLQKATTDMKLGVNNINQEVITVKHNLGPSYKEQPAKPIVKPKHQTEKSPTQKPKKSSILALKHSSNLAAVTIGVAGLGWYMFR